MTPDDPLKNQTIQAAPIPAESVRDQDKIQLVLAYLGLLALIPMLTVKDSDYVQWHAKQGLVLGVGGAIALTILGAIPFLGLITCLAGPALLVLDIMAMVKSLNGERWRIPVVTDLAEKL